MTHPVKGVDHVYLLVNDLDASAALYRRLGFTLSPRGLHSKEKGTGNYTIMFPQDYFELLGIVAETPGNQFQRDRLARDGEGLSAIACRIDTAVAAKQQLTALGLATGDVGVFSRPVDLPNGSTGVAAFETVQFAGSEVPQGSVFMCQHKTRETVWLPELLDHANGGKGLSAIVALSANPAATAERFARLYADGKVTVKDGDEASVATGKASAEIIVLSPQRAAEYYPNVDFTATPSAAFAGLRIRTGSLDQAKAALNAGGIAWIETPFGIGVAPDQASGTLLEFVAG